MTPARLQAEVRRCTREDGTIGLASVCNPCHFRAGSKHYKIQTKMMRSAARNRKLDNAAKLARGRCECDDETCRRPVTKEDVASFEWDHFVQSFDDPDYHLVGALVSSGKSVLRCDQEREKCRLMYIECHRRHSADQRHRRRAQQGR